MRIISQNGEVDFPYEQFVVAIDATTKTSILAFPVSVTDDVHFNLAEYSTKEKAVKAMEMLRIECGNFVETSNINGNYFAFDYPKLFRFPQDSEV